MSNTIRAGSRLRLAAGSTPRFGELWAFVSDEGDVVVHRCLGRRGGRLLFQGDAAPVPDPLVAPDRLVGRVVALVAEPGAVERPLAAHERWLGGPRLEARRLARSLARPLRQAGRRIRAAATRA